MVIFYYKVNILYYESASTYLNAHRHLCYLGLPNHCYKAGNYLSIRTI